MSSVCAEQHKFHTSHHLLSSKKSHHLLREVDIPPRKLLTRRSAAHQDLSSSPDMYGATDSPRFSASDEALLRKFLPYNTGASDDDEDASDDPYSSDHFRMFEFKVRRCTRSRSHDWTDCPFAHPGEKARRRDPRRYHYSGTVCADYRRGGCSRGDSCEFAHGVFECWLHPARYRTEACKDGKNCKRKVCFFAHTPRQLRILPVNHSRSSSPDELVISSPISSCCKKSNKYLNSANSPGSSTHCCLFCRSVTSSPTSTLLGMSHLSPPLSPMSPYGESKCHFSTGLESLDQMHASAAGMLSYKDVLSELMTSLEVMKLSNMEATTSPVSSPISSAATTAASYRNTPWVDVSSYNAFAAEDQQQHQFILSPSTPSPLSAGTNFFSRSTSGNFSRKSLVFDEQNKATDINAGGCSSDPDLGWVNDLLM